MVLMTLGISSLFNNSFMLDISTMRKWLAVIQDVRKESCRSYHWYKQIGRAS